MHRTSFIARLAVGIAVVVSVAFLGGTAHAASAPVGGSGAPAGYLAPTAQVLPAAPMPGDGPSPPPPGYYFSNRFTESISDPRSARVQCIELGNEFVFNDVASDYYCWLTAPGIAELWIIA